MRQPLAGGYAELIVTPAETLLEELARGETRDLPLHPLFRRRSRRLDPHLQLLRARFLSCTAVDGGVEPLAAEELVVRLLRAALEGHGRARLPARSSQRLVDRTKTFLSAELGRSLTLSEISRTVGASPGYLTQLFHDLEGVPLHRYLTQLRLSRALCRAAPCRRSHRAGAGARVLEPQPLLGAVPSGLRAHPVRVPARLPPRAPPLLV